MPCHNHTVAVVSSTLLLLPSLQGARHCVPVDTHGRAEGWGRLYNTVRNIPNRKK